MAEYKVLKVSQDAPREWQGPHGTVYYIKTMLEGHAKPVSVGKKKPDALRAGDTVYGTIEPSDLPEDKFKAEARPQQASFGGGGFSSPKPAYHDNSDGQRQGMCFNNAADYINRLADARDGTTKNLLTPEKWAEEVYKYANELYKLGDLGKATSEPLPEPPDREDDAVDAVKNAMDIPDDAESINLDEIPF